MNFSFISEHFMINKKIMKELIHSLTLHTSPNESWVEFILKSIGNDYLEGSGFSEFETYGTFLAHKYKERFACRPLKSARNATKLYGISPNKYDIFWLMLSRYTFATFEFWQSSSRALLFLNKMTSIIIYADYLGLWQLPSRCIKSRFKNASEICCI